MFCFKIYKYSITINPDLKIFKSCVISVPLKQSIIIFRMEVTEITVQDLVVLFQTFAEVTVNYLIVSRKWVQKGNPTVLSLPH